MSIVSDVIDAIDTAKATIQSVSEARSSQPVADGDQSRPICYVWLGPDSSTPQNQNEQFCITQTDFRNVYVDTVCGGFDALEIARAEHRAALIAPLVQGARGYRVQGEPLELSGGIIVWRDTYQFAIPYQPE